MQTIFVKPAPGAAVRLPADPKQFLPAEGAQVPLTQFWGRRLADGSVVKSAPLKGGK